MSVRQLFTYKFYHGNWFHSHIECLWRRAYLLSLNNMTLILIYWCVVVFPYVCSRIFFCLYIKLCVRYKLMPNTSFYLFLFHYHLLYTRFQTLKKKTHRNTLIITVRLIFVKENLGRKICITPALWR